MFNTIRTVEDINNFLDKTNGLHDGYVIGVQYANGGISKTEYGYYFDPKQTKLILQILVTSLRDTIVEIEFENLLEWQIRDNQWEITDTSVFFNERNWVVWSDDIFISSEEMKTRSYAIAESMKWRIVEQSKVDSL